MKKIIAIFAFLLVACALQAQTTTTFKPTSEANDAYIHANRPSSDYAWATNTVPTISPSDVFAGPSWIAIGQAYWKYNSTSYEYSTYMGMIRFDTSSLPGNAVISSAKLRFFTYSTGAIQDTGTSCRFGIGYYSGALDHTAWTTTAQTSAYSSGSKPPTVASNTWVEYPLTNPDTNVVKGGATGFRLTMTGCSVPSGSSNVSNRYEFYDYSGGATYMPQLVVTYTIPAIPQVTLTPSSASMTTKKTQQFTVNTPVTYTLSPNLGSIDSNGLYTAPNTLASSPTTVTLTATSTGDSNNKASATITITDPAVSISPTSSYLLQGQTAQFTASVTGSPDNTVTWSVSGPGSIDQNGLYTAPASVTTHSTATVTATLDYDGTTVGTAMVTLDTASMTFTLTNGNDIGRLPKQKAGSWPDDSTTGGIFQGDDFLVSSSYTASTNVYEKWLTAFRFDTAGLPDDAVVSRAILTLTSNGLYSSNNTSNCTVGLGWYSGTIDEASWTSQPQTSAFSGRSYELYASDGQAVQLSLTSPDTVRKTGYTGFRMHISSVTISTLSSDANCMVQFYGSNAVAGQKPTLTVYYSSAPRRASKLIFVQEQ